MINLEPIQPAIGLVEWIRSEQSRAVAAEGDVPRQHQNAKVVMSQKRSVSGWALSPSK